MAKNTSVIGIYPDKTTVSEAASVLHNAGYRAADIAVMVADNPGTKDFAHIKSNESMDGAAAGAGGGIIVGGVLGWLLATNVISIPGLDALAAVKPFIAALAGAGFAGTLGWIVGFFLGMGIPVYVAKRYAGRLNRGGILMSVHCDSPEWCSRTTKFLRDTGARSISTAAESSADYAATDKPTPRAPSPIVDRDRVPDHLGPHSVEHVALERDGVKQQNAVNQNRVV